jgi:hypothetical protein
MSAARLVAALAALVLVSSLPAPRRAEACGGCFAPSTTVTAVDSHRMVVLLSPERSVLWDQIAYSGAPEDFVWVLPVPGPEVVVELADTSFFDELDGQTSPVVQTAAWSSTPRGRSGPTRQRSSAARTAARCRTGWSTTAIR